MADKYFVALADGEQRRFAINLESVTWVEFKGDPEQPQSASVHFSVSGKPLTLKKEQAVLMQQAVETLRLNQRQRKAKPKGRRRPPHYLDSRG